MSNQWLKQLPKLSREMNGLPVLTLTADNGREFSNHEAIAKELNADFYFAHPYSSWEGERTRMAAD